MSRLRRLTSNLAALLLLSALALPTHATSDTYSSSGTWTAPSGVSLVKVEVWGGGGGGGSQQGKGAGGGGSGAYAAGLVPVTPGSNYSYTVGLGGNSGSAGGTSSFSYSGGTISAGGGGAGSGNFGGTAGTATAGTTLVAGCAGGDSSGNLNPGGGGGGSPSDTVSCTAGAPATISGPGAGGNGYQSGGNGGASQQSGTAGGIGAGGGGGGKGATGGVGGPGRIVITYFPTTTLATGTDPAAATIAPGAAASDVNQFTFQTSSGAETISSVTVNLSTSSGIARLAITNSSNTELGFTTSPATGSNTITLTSSITASTTVTTYKVRVTPLSHAGMPAVPGSAYAVTAPVTAWVGTTSAQWHGGSDTNANALTIDNQSPNAVTGTGASAGDSKVTLNWTTSSSTDFSRSVVLRWSASTAGSEVPAEGTSYSVGNTIGTATVACVRTSDAPSTALSDINGAGGSGCSTTALTNGQTYYYKVFQQDSNGNYDAGAAIGPFTPGIAAATITTNAATGISATGATLNGTVNPNGSTTTVRFDHGTSSGSYSASCTPASNSFTGSTAQSFSCALTSLSCGTTYYFRAAGTNGGGTSYGSELSFATSSCVSSFNAFETSTAANAITGVIQTKIAGSAFNLDVVAISGSAQATSFSGSVKLELLANSGTPGSGYGSDNCPSTNSVLQTIASTTISGGRTTASFSPVADVYRDVRVRISYPTSSPTISVCSTDSFAIRPNTISLIAQDADMQSAGTTRTLNNVAATSGTVHKAGRPFTLAATAYNAAGTPAVTANYAGTGSLSVGSCSGAACIASPASSNLAPSTATFSAGNFVSNTASYTDVGAFSLTMQDTSFAGIDAADTSASCSGYYVCSSATAIGRFVPNHLTTSVTQGCNSGAYTYSGQPFSVTVTAYAYNLTSALQNYSASTGLAQAVTLSDPNNTAGGTLAGTSIAASSFTAGAATQSSASYAFTNRATSPTSITLRATDADQVNSSGQTEGSVSIRGGRVRLLNAYGSEQLDLPMTLRAEYWNGSGWVQNTQDNCTGDTSLGAANAVTLSRSPTLSCVLDNGSPGLSGIGCSTAGATSPTDKRYREGTTMVTGPAPLQKGDFNLWLQKPTGAGSLTLTADVPAWLEFPWTGSSASDPSARATFGVYKSPYIYRRENY